MGAGARWPVARRKAIADRVPVDDAVGLGEVNRPARHKVIANGDLASVLAKLYPHDQANCVDGNRRGGSPDTKGATMGIHATAILAAFLSLASATAGGAAEASLLGIWNADGGGLLELKDGGLFVGTRDDGDTFAGKWKVEPAGTLALERDDGESAQCPFTVTDKTLTLTDCPASGTYSRSE